MGQKPSQGQLQPAAVSARRRFSPPSGRGSVLGRAQCYPGGRPGATRPHSVETTATSTAMTIAASMKTMMLARNEPTRLTPAPGP